LIKDWEGTKLPCVILLLVSGLGFTITVFSAQYERLHRITIITKDIAKYMAATANVAVDD